MAVISIISFFIVDTSSKEVELVQADLPAVPSSNHTASRRMWAGRAHEIQYRSNLFKDDKYSASRGNACFVNTLQGENVS